MAEAEKIRTDKASSPYADILVHLRYADGTGYIVETKGEEIAWQRQHGFSVQSNAYQLFDPPAVCPEWLGSCVERETAARNAYRRNACLQTAVNAAYVHGWTVDQF